METGNRLGLRLFYVIVILVILVALTYFFWMKDAPYKVFTPEGYPQGAQISVYKNLPEGFPDEVILEDKEFNGVGTLTTANQKTKTTVSYVSDKALAELAVMYENNFISMGWTITAKSISKNVGILQANKDGGKMILTIAPFLQKMVVTFQYEK